MSRSSSSSLAVRESALPALPARRSLQPAAADEDDELPSFTCARCAGKFKQQFESDYFQALHRDSRELAPACQAADELPAACINQGYFRRFFVIIKKLGCGTGGSVYLCKHLINGNFLGLYAVKIIPVGNSGAWLHGMLREVNMLAGLRHENIISYKHTWIEVHQPSNGTLPVPCLFILMEYANAGSLEDFIGASASCSSQLRAYLPFLAACSAGYFEKCRQILLQISKGLQHLSHVGIIHHDIKPANILLTKSMHDESFCVLISDFGICETREVPLEPAERTGGTGTLEFMAPELLAVDLQGRLGGRDGYDAGCDVWSFGLLAYVLLYGRLPFADCPAGQNYQAFMRAQIFGLNSAAIFFNSSVRYAKINALIRHCLQQDARQRPAFDWIVGVCSDEALFSGSSWKLWHFAIAVLAVLILAVLLGKVLGWQ